ncbi:hypothetical protein [Novosphingobium mangrovi (ex Huang et al. 2023)]|uniref:Uncharacterized protein n=1 Tax=Novosphingobium mangrovi (ex Huang et al. 2023) TaxID=2976432 RepID=A0ABT2I904_9SPHN|nr:hypothetical protein [Novosphingobium mangrovi (ex Huang et al. 2023)]MCT2401273.1 hypothetical protein [Novosphingobium mangrovi (ex Huang et al. 2023)]
MRRCLIMGGLVLQAAPLAAHGESIKALGANAVQFMPATLEWSATDRTTVERAKSKDLATDNGDAGWGLEALSLRSRRESTEPIGATRMKMHVREVKIEGWHSLGPDTVFTLRAFAGTTSRRDRESPVSWRKTHAGNVGIEAVLEHASGWQIRGGWFAQGGWGGRSLEQDVVRMANGEPAAARGARVALQMPPEEGWPMMSIEAMSGAKALASGAPLVHRAEIALRLATSF